MIDENVLERLKPYLTEVSYPKGYVLFNSEKLERNIYFIKRGMARAFVEADGRDITIWFGQEGDVIISARGYVYGEKGYETMALLEDSELYRVNGMDLQDLYRNDIVVCNWARRLIEREFVRTEHHLIANLSEPAADRYMQLLREKPEILRRVQLQHVASFLGISSEYLSRIRAITKNRTK